MKIIIIIIITILLIILFSQAQKLEKGKSVVLDVIKLTFSWIPGYYKAHQEDARLYNEKNSDYWKFTVFEFGGYTNESKIFRFPMKSNEYPFNKSDIRRIWKDLCEVWKPLAIGTDNEKLYGKMWKERGRYFISHVDDIKNVYDYFYQVIKLSRKVNLLDWIRDIYPEKFKIGLLEYSEIKSAIYTKIRKNSEVFLNSDTDPPFLQSITICYDSSLTLVHCAVSPELKVPPNTLINIYPIFNESLVAPLHHVGLVIMWIPGFYRQNNISIQLYRGHNFKDFSIHGLWPEKKNNRDFRGNITGLDKFLTENMISSSLKQEINKYWKSTRPGFSSNFNFARHEWDTHGIFCVRQVPKIKNGIDYLRVTLTLYRSVELIAWIKSSEISRKQFESNKISYRNLKHEIDRKFRKRTIVDVRDGIIGNVQVLYLFEVKLCYNVELEKMDCPPHKDDKYIEINPDIIL